MPPRHLHNHLRHPLFLALTNDRRVGKTRISDKVIISVLSKDDLHIQAALCTTVKLNLEWRFYFPSS